MAGETDPMLGTAEEQDAYIAQVVAAMEQQAEADKAARLTESAPAEAPPVIIGTAGQSAGIRVVE